jgi:Flp pilus assembly protein TadD
VNTCTTTINQTSQDRDQDPQYQYEKAVVAYRYGLKDEALKYLQRALELAPDHSPSYNLLGLIFLEKGNLSQAVGYYQKAIELNPEFPEALYGLGRAYEELGEKEKALTVYQHSYQLAPKPEVAFSLAKALYLSQRLEEALRIVDKLLESQPTPGAYNLQGVILNHLGRYGEAVESFQQALKLAPEDEVAAVNLGVALVNSGAKDKARALFEKLLPRLKNPELRVRVEDFLRQIKN